ncbi:gluconate 2-dehydrogenase subunit 3 family protein [uncultured Paraglaciecola sp.]|uniref:gluconate 2-dehydrogenase subunit 3 family protein n=1 Tax=uncultured Paraglaciecola sp. TaxID=1765024 RepID=UPI0030D8404C|tara:strand:+ start:31196 stop:31765 length:570 start_codon:yes stop_codon:yes gene_type:complete
MDRRQILKYTAMLTGTAICAPLTGIMLSGCDSQLKETSTSLSPADFFSAEDFNLMTQIMDVILPRTETPSASDVKVNFILDSMFAEVYPADYQQKFTRIFNELKSFLAANHFDSLSSSEQESLLLSIEVRSEDARNNAYWSYIDIKQQTVAFYLSTEQIAENHLNYLPIPGEYKPCVSVADLGGKAWAI